MSKKLVDNFSAYSPTAREAMNNLHRLNHRKDYEDFYENLMIYDGLGDSDSGSDELLNYKEKIEISQFSDMLKNLVTEDLRLYLTIKFMNGFKIDLASDSEIVELNSVIKDHDLKRTWEEMKEGRARTAILAKFEEIEKKSFARSDEKPAMPNNTVAKLYEKGSLKKTETQNRNV